MRQIIRRWFVWLGKESKDQSEEDIKIDWVKRIPMLIHGPKKGQTFQPELYGHERLYQGEFKKKLTMIDLGQLSPTDVDWFQDLFVQAHSLPKR
jgi:hypothetical protein